MMTIIGRKGLAYPYCMRGSILRLVLSTQPYPHVAQVCKHLSNVTQLLLQEFYARAALSGVKSADKPNGYQGQNGSSN